MPLMRFLTAAALAVGLLTSVAPKAAQAQECITGEIRMFGFNFAPRGWAFAQGQLLDINSNQALFSLYGTTYGGDGRTTFGLPDLRGRAPIGMGTGPGLSNRIWGEKGGSETNVLNADQLPAHTHSLMATTAPGASSDPTGNLLADDQNDRIYAAGSSATVAMAGTAIGSTGASAPVNNVQPYLAMNYAVCMVGIYPSRS